MQNTPNTVTGEGKAPRNHSLERGACTRCDCKLPHPKHPARRCTLAEWRGLWAAYQKVSAPSDWFWQMVAVDPNPKKAEEVYSFEVEEIEEAMGDEDREQHAIEGTYSNFNRYIAGDR